MKKPLINFRSSISSSTRSSIFSLGIGGLCLIGSAQAAQDTAVYVGPYVSGNVGVGSTSLQKGGIDSAVGTQGVRVTSGSSDTQDVSYGANLGYRLSRNFAVEAGYVNLGSYSYQSNASPSGSVSGEFEAEGLTAAGVGIVPLGNGFSAYGKLGVIGAHTRLTKSGLGTGDATHDSIGLLAGLGASYDITPKVAATLEWNHYGGLGNPSTAYGSVNTYTVGAKYRF